MSFLVYNSVKAEVEVIAEAMEFIEIKQLFAFDHTDDKRQYKQAITYVYHVYKKDHPLSNNLPQKRKEKVCKEYLADAKTPEGMDSNLFIVNLVKRFIEEQYSPKERFYEKIKRDMEELMDHISNIPFTRKVKIKQMVPVSVNGGSQDVFVDTHIDVDNSEEKLKAIQKAQQLLDLENKIAAAIVSETRNRQTGSISSSMLQNKKFG